MSKISLKPNASGTATFEIQAPATNTNRVLELPDEAGTILSDVSDIELQVKTATNASGNAPIYACRAWVNFDGTNGAIRASGNVSSVTRNAAGDYTVNLTTAMPDANYSASALSTQRTGTGINRGIGIRNSAASETTFDLYSTTQVRLQHLASNGAAVDAGVCAVAIFR